MTDMIKAKRSEIECGSGTENGGLDLLGAMIRSVDRNGKNKSHLLTDSEMLGNAFVFMFAGHETTANSLHYILIYLALNRKSQSRLQADISSVFGCRPISKWDYDLDFPRLASGMAGAVMAEQLRLVPPIIEIPKLTSSPQHLSVNGKRCTIPANTLVHLSTAAAHRNPNFWPHGPASDPAHPMHPESNLDNDLEEFKPERWLLNASQQRKQQKPKVATPPDSSDSSDSVELASSPLSNADALDSLFRPFKGSYLPFSHGARACLGRRFAQVEVLAALAVIFSEWSVELDVGEWASEEEVEAMAEDEKKAVWERARGRALWIFREQMTARVTLKMKSGLCVPLRLVRKGEERFGGNEEKEEEVL